MSFFLQNALIGFGKVAQGVGAGLICESQKKERIKDKDNIPSMDEIQEIRNNYSNIPVPNNNQNIYIEPIITEDGETHEKSNYTGDKKYTTDYLSLIDVKKAEKARTEINIENLELNLI